MHKFKRILIIQTAFLGDVVLTVPLIMALRRAYPNSYLCAMVIPQVREILQDNPALDEIIVYDKKDKEKSWLSFLRLCKKIKAQNFDLAILPHRSFKSALLTFLAKIPCRIGFNISEGSLLLTDKIIYREGKNIHEIERNLSLLDRLDVADKKVEFFLRAGKNALSYSLSMMKKYQIDANDLVVGINPGSVWPTKRYPVEKFAALADKIVKELDATIFIIGGPEDKQIADQVVGQMKERVINIAGETTIKQLIAISQRFNLLITNDSGAMHIAVAQNVPVVAIFGPTTRELGFYPYGQKDIVVEKKLPCRPCGKHGGNRCPQKNFACMKLITIGEVFDAVRRRLNL